MNCSMGLEHRRGYGVDDRVGNDAGTYQQRHGEWHHDLAAAPTSRLALKPTKLGSIHRGLRSAKEVAAKVLKLLFS